MKKNTYRDRALHLVETIHRLEDAAEEFTTRKNGSGWSRGQFRSARCDLIRVALDLAAAARTMRSRS